MGCEVPQVFLVKYILFIHLFTFILLESWLKEVERFQMLWCCCGERHDFSYCFMEALIGSISQQEGLHGICHVVLNVPHLMVRCQEVIHCHLGAHLDPMSHRKASVVRDCARAGCCLSPACILSSPSMLSCKSEAWRKSLQNSFIDLEIALGA